MRCHSRQQSMKHTHWYDWCMKPLIRFTQTCMWPAVSEMFLWPGECRHKSPERPCTRHRSNLVTCNGGLGLKWECPGQVKLLLFQSCRFCSVPLSSASRSPHWLRSSATPAAVVTFQYVCLPCFNYILQTKQWQQQLNRPDMCYLNLQAMSAWILTSTLFLKCTTERLLWSHIFSQVKDLNNPRLLTIIANTLYFYRLIILTNSICSRIQFRYIWAEIVSIFVNAQPYIPVCLLEV